MMSLVLACLCALLLPILTSSLSAPPPPPTTLPYSALWQGFVPTSVRYSNRTGLIYQLGSDVWKDIAVSPYLTIANLTTGRILHRLHYAEAHPELQLDYIEHLVWDSPSSSLSRSSSSGSQQQQQSLLILLLWSEAQRTSYILRADGVTGEELSLAAMPYELWLIGLDSTGSVVYTFFAGSNEFVAFEIASGKRVQAFNATSTSTIYAGVVHPLTGIVYLHDIDVTGNTATNRIVLVDPQHNTVLSTISLPPLDPSQDELVDTQLAIDSSGHYLDVFLTIRHPDNVNDWYVHQFDVSTLNTTREIRTWQFDELTDEVMLGGQISAGPAGSDWLVVDVYQRQAYWQQNTNTNSTLLIGLPILPFNFHVLVDDHTHNVFVSTGDESSITVLEVTQHGDLVRQFYTGPVDCGHAGFYAPIAALDYHTGAESAQLLIPQCNNTIQVFDRTAHWIGQYLTNQSVNLVIITTDRLHHKLYMTTDKINIILEIDLRTWTTTQRFITGNESATDGDRIRSLVVDEQRRLLYAGDYWNGRLYTFSLDHPTAPLSVYNYTAPSGYAWAFTSLALSGNGSQLFASWNTEAGESCIAVIDSATGKLMQQLLYPSLGDGRDFYNIGGLAVDVQRDTLYLSVGEEDGVFVTRNISKHVAPPSSFDTRITQRTATAVITE